MAHLEGHRSALSVTRERKREAIPLAPLSHHAWPMVFWEKSRAVLLLALILEAEGNEISGLQHSFYRPLPPNADGGPPQLPDQGQKLQVAGIAALEAAYLGHPFLPTIPTDTPP